ncbi:MAG TPA: Fe-S-cluster-containing hydrogenase [Kofleriaceae bacterium]|nr:Fe-S-cluster-containing hydrogenase [Kofleriaceae bacterium]
MSSLEKKHWRSLSDLVSSQGGDEPTPEAAAYLEQRIPDHQELFGDPLSRRRFMQLMGASVAFAGAAGMAGCRWDEDKIVPLDRRPDGYVPGVPKYFASAAEVAGAAYGLLVTAYDGRPIKVDGNPDHPHTGRGSTAFVQASILELYDPDRSRSVERRAGGKALGATWADWDSTARKLVAALAQTGGRGLRVLSEATSSPTIAALRRELLSATRFPQARWHEWEPLSRDNEREGMRLAFGRPLRVHLQLARARVIAALDADILQDHADGMRLARDLMSGRDPDARRGGMNRLYAVESTFTLTGASADHRLPLRSELIKPFLLALEQRIQGAGGAASPSKAMAEPKVARFLEVLAKDLAQNRGAAVIAVGPRQPAEVHAIAARVNALLGAQQTVVYTEDPDPERPSHAADLEALVADMQSGAVDTLLILGGNPVYDAPAGLDFAGALAKVKTSVHLSSYSDETSAACTWHLPRAHYLEAWGDARTWDGTYTLAQPVIEPIFGGRSAIDVLKVFAGRGDASAERLVHDTFDATVGAAAGLGGWRKALHDGYVPGTAAQPVLPTLAAFQVAALTPTQTEGTRLPNGKLEVTFVASPHTYDGRFANNAWLQETPDFLGKVTWDNAALISPKTASELGVQHEEIVEVSVGDRKVEVVAYVMPGQAPFSIALQLGQGRTRAGHVGGLTEDGVDPVGFDTYRVRNSAAQIAAGGGKVRGTGAKYRLSTTVDHFRLDKLGTDATQKRIPELVKEASLEEYRHDPSFVSSNAHTPDIAVLTSPTTADSTNRSLYKEHRYEEASHKWGMVTDLSKCCGCNACVVACTAENNVPVVGKEQVWRNREMHWLRIDRYFAGDPDDPEVAHQPILCQQCENAPCEQVCPVGATIHTDEGLNDMVYNRCVGTRYCLNNCPYRVRRFNFLRWDWMKELDDPRAKVRALLFNPEVTVRSRGVMEKCTFCVQRIQNAKIKAKNERRPLADGEIRTACQDACPTGAIVFGDLNDDASQVSAGHKLPRAYMLLAELNTRPRHAFLARIRNPHPDLAAADRKASEAH